MQQLEVTLFPLDLSNQDHVKWLFTVRSHPEVDRYLLHSPPSSFQEHFTFLKQSSNTRNFFLICQEEKLVGYCHMVNHPDSIELGWALHPNFWGKGIGSRAVSLLLQEASKLNVFQKKKVILSVLKSNTRAINLYKKCGFLIDTETEVVYTMVFPSGS